MPTWFDKAHDRRVSWSAETTERSREATPDAPVAWIARSVLEALGRSAEYGAPHAVDGELLGYWVTPRAELVIVDWTGFGSMLFREASDASASIGPPMLRYAPPNPVPERLRAPLGVWSTRPDARVADERGSHGWMTATRISPSAPFVHLVLERDQAWKARLSVTPPHRWPWDALRQPRHVELRVFSAPRS